MAILRGDERVALVEVARSEWRGAGRQRLNISERRVVLLTPTVNANADAALPAARFT